MKEKKPERRKLSPDTVRNNARESGGGAKYFNLPKGVDLWEPDKAGTFNLDIVPYEIKTDKHPDRRGDKVIPGDLWWKFPFSIHQRIGPNSDDVVCPATFGLPCPICEERKRLADDDYEANKTAIKAINSKKQAAYVIKRPGGEDGEYSVFAYSAFKFGDPLDEELKSAEDENLGFYFLDDTGKTLKTRFSEEEYMGRKFFKASRFDFIDREAMDEDEVVEAVPCLDEIFIVMDYDELKELFLQVPADEKATGKGKAGKSATTAKTGKAKNPPAEETESPFKIGDKVSFKDAKGKPQTGKVADVDGDTISITYGAGLEIDVAAGKVTMAGKSAAKAPPAEEPEDEEGVCATDPDFKIGVTVKNAKGVTGEITGIDGDDITYTTAKGKAITADVAELEVVESEEPEEDPADAPDPEDAEPAKFKKGDKVKKDDGVEGVITAIDGDDVKFKTAKGKIIEADIDDIELLEDEEPADADEPDEEPEEPDADESDPEDAEFTPAVGVTVSFTIPGTKKTTTGKILKIDANDDATIKADDGKKYTVDVDELSAAPAGDADEPEEEPDADADEDPDEDEGVAFAVGQEVTYDEGTEEGVITKLHPDGTRVKIGDKWVPIAEVEAKAAPAKAKAKVKK